MNKLYLLFAAISSAALALPPVHPVLPPVEYIDTETTTNVPFMAWQEHVGKFKFSLTRRTTATNNVQFAFGRDADDDGALALEESDLVVGWDCGTVEWSIPNACRPENLPVTDTNMFLTTEQVFSLTADGTARVMKFGYMVERMTNEMINLWRPYGD